MTPDTRPGATYLERGGCYFRVWAPYADKLEIHLISPADELVPLEKDDAGYFCATLKNIEPGARYYCRINGDNEYPDPASLFQPEGVHGPSQVTGSTYTWEDQNWPGILLKDYVLYELHVGSYTREGTFRAIIPFLDELAGIGINAVELMPVAQFPGRCNWGYDGVFPFAVQNSYGGPDGLKELVNACHIRGLAVVLDVVYNHLGPEGNYFEKYGPYFTDRYKTPWGKALNFDGPFSDEVRHLFIENAAYWINEFHIDALRLDALHAILDMSARPFLADLSTRVNSIREKSNKRIYLIGESDANDRRVVLSQECNGYGIDAQWNDDFHHSLHALLTDERKGYYSAFGQVADLAAAFREGFVYTGQYSDFRKRRHGSPSKDIPAYKLVVFIQNHDQAGNRLLGERLNRLVSFEKLKLAAGAVIFSPFLPLIFMGQEYGEPAPFQYFVNHSDPALIEAVKQGRRLEFASFSFKGEIPDPQSEETFLCTKLDHSLKKGGKHQILLKFYKELLRLRREILALNNLSKDELEVIGYEETRLLYLRRWCNNRQAIIVFNFNNLESSMVLPVPPGHWKKIVDSEDKKWFGTGTRLARQFCSRGETKLTLKPGSFVLYTDSAKEA